MSESARTVGVEEEFILMRVDRQSLAADGDDVVERAEAMDKEGQFEHELKRPQAELGSSPTASLTELEAELQSLRAELATAAEGEGARLVAIATSPLADAAPTTDSDRYQRMDEQFGLVAREQLTCGMHVHVSIASPEEAVAVANRIRPWLATLIALSANSPLYRGQDTGYASYRTVLWGRWPTAGPTAYFHDAAGYRQLEEDLLRLGAAGDDGMIYFDARLSRRYPTLEIRVCDVCARTEDAALIAALARAMVDTAAQQWRAGSPSPDIRTELLRAASWRAARWGMTGELASISTPVVRLRPAWDAVQELLDWIAPALRRSADTERVQDGLRRIRTRGTGAELQRAAAASGGGIAAALDALTIAPAPRPPSLPRAASGKATHRHSIKKGPR